MRKWIACLLMILLLVSICGCKKKVETSESSEISSETTTAELADTSSDTSTEGEPSSTVETASEDSSTASKMETTVSSKSQPSTPSSSVQTSSKVPTQTKTTPSNKKDDDEYVTEYTYDRVLHSQWGCMTYDLGREFYEDYDGLQMINYYELEFRTDTIAAIERTAYTPGLDRPDWCPRINYNGEEYIPLDSDLYIGGYFEAKNGDIEMVLKSEKRDGTYVHDELYFTRIDAKTLKLTSIEYGNIFSFKIGDTFILK